MKKCLLLIALFVLAKGNMLFAQTLFNAPDTVCVNQPVHLTSNIFNQDSYYWGFCSGYLMNAPTGTNLGTDTAFHMPANIDLAYDNGNYYGFVVNARTTELLRLNFGNSLTNTPTITNFGNLTNGLPVNPMSVFIVHDTAAKEWFVFVAGGYTQATSTMGRVDFGAHLNNPHPNVANFGNWGNYLNAPRGIFIAKQPDGHWFGYVVNRNNSQLIRLDFQFNISTTPMPSGQGNGFGTINSPTDMAGIWNNGNWYLFVTNAGDNTVARIGLGTTLDTLTPPGGVNLGNFDFRINAPSSISINADCGNTYAYVTDSTTSQLIAIQMPDVSDASTYTGVDYSIVGGMNYPTGISNIFRDNDNLYGFITNSRDSSLTRIEFDPCHHSTIPSFTDVAPPVYSYDTPGVYNVYYVVNQGLPTMQVECKEIRVLAPPPIYKSNDTTICQGDSLRLYVVSSQADSIRWTSTYAIDTTNQYQDSVRVYPGYTTTYPIVLYYPFGCIVDTSITIRVHKVHADAGPDRYILDGASTIIGGPYTTLTDTFNDFHANYYWTPFQFLSDSLAPNPVANPPYDYTYYLTVSDTSDGIACIARDTMTVHVSCGDFYVPNAFAPNSESSATNRFGLLNSTLAKLNYFRIYDRWGVLVFETTDPSEGWDGTYNGKPEPSDVYVWIADGFCIKGKEVKRSGNVTLLR